MLFLRNRVSRRFPTGLGLSETDAVPRLQRGRGGTRRWAALLLPLVALQTPKQGFLWLPAPWRALRVSAVSLPRDPGRSEFDPTQNLTGCIWVNFSDTEEVPVDIWNATNGTNRSTAGPFTLVSEDATGNGTGNGTSLSGTGQTARRLGAAAALQEGEEGEVLIYEFPWGQTPSLGLALPLFGRRLGAAVPWQIPEEADGWDVGGYWVNCTSPAPTSQPWRGLLEEESLGPNATNATNFTSSRNATADGVDVTLRFVLAFDQLPSLDSESPSTAAEWARTRREVLAQAVGGLLGIAPSSDAAGGGLSSHVRSIEVRALDDAEFDNDGQLKRLLSSADVETPSGRALLDGLDEVLPQETRRFRSKRSWRPHPHARELNERKLARVLVIVRIRLGEADHPAAMLFAALEAAARPSSQGSAASNGNSQVYRLDLPRIVGSLRALLQERGDKMPQNLQATPAEWEDWAPANTTQIQTVEEPQKPLTGDSGKIPSAPAPEPGIDSGGGAEVAAPAPGPESPAEQMGSGNGLELKESQGPPTLGGTEEKNVAGLSQKVLIGLICTGAGALLVCCLICIMMKSKMKVGESTDARRKRLDVKAKSYGKAQTVPLDAVQDAEKEPEEEKAGGTDPQVVEGEKEVAAEMEGEKKLGSTEKDEGPNEEGNKEVENKEVENKEVEKQELEKKEEVKTEEKPGEAS